MNRLPKFKIKSLYMKWMLLFTGLIIAAQAFTLGLVFQFIMPDIVSEIGTELYRKAEFVQNLHQQGFDVNREMFEELGDTDINFIILDDTEFNKDFEKYTVSLNALQQAHSGEIVSFYTNVRFVEIPSYLVRIGDKVAVLTLDVNNNVVWTFASGIQKSILMAAIIASTFIVIALIVVIKPIKKVTEATREVARGNFKIQLKTKSVDEVGQLIENFNLMALELQKNDYLRKDFVSSVSHEFKTPITSIEGFAKLLKSGNLTEEQFDEYTEIIISETARLSNLSSNLLKLSVLDNTAFEPTKTEFYIDEQIRSVVLLLESQWAEKNISFDIDMNEVLFNGNEELLSQVWINIIQNAIKFSPKSGTIVIALKENTDAITVSITNKGAVILPEHRDKIFRRFYKADKARSKEGNGLGLSIAKRIVEISKGDIYFESSVKDGTTFFITLPNIKF